MKFQANPIIVEAFKIVEIKDSDSSGLKVLTLENGFLFLPTPEMLARIAVEIGDYLIQQEDGYIYLNPKKVFERKYSPIVE